MSSLASVKQRPLSPPISTDEDHNLHSLAEYNGNMDGYPPPGYVSAQQSGRSTYGDPSQYHTAPINYHSAQPTFYRNMEPRTPPSNYDEAIITRSGRALGSSLDPNRPVMSRRSRSPPKPKKARTPKTKPKGGPAIEGPLSEVTKDYALPIKDMGAWVNRSAEARRKEAEKKGGHVARPMNSFMLYRSAYAERVKQFCKENNHQVVSQVSGASWPMEPVEIRSLYEKYASLERENHQKAHPDYKFAPNKSQNNRKRKGYDTEDETDGDDPEWGSHRSSSSKRQKSGHNSQRSTPFDDIRTPEHPRAWIDPQYRNPSSWEASNAGRPPPHMMAPQAGQYYLPQYTQYDPYTQDVSMRRTEGPTSQYRGSTPIVGMPSGDHHELLLPHSHTSTPMPSESIMDPALQGTGHVSQYGHEPEYATNYQYTSAPVASGDYQYPSQTPAYHPGLQTFTDGREAWQGGGLGAGTEFDEQFQMMPH